MLEFADRRQRKAQKAYFCDLCGALIRRGAEYIYEAQKGDDGFLVTRRHIHCDAMLDAYLADSDAAEYSADEVRDWICDGACGGCDYGADCDQAGCFECEFAQQKLLRPAILEAARQSVRENAD